LKTLYLVVIFLILSIFTLNAEINTTTEIEKKIEDIENIKVEKEKKAQKLIVEQRTKEEADKINERLLEIDHSLKTDIWYTKYNNHQIYLDIETELHKIEEKMKRLNKDSEKFMEFSRQERALENRLELLSDFKITPFESLVKPEDLEKIPAIENPFSIIDGFTYLKTMKKYKEIFSNKLNSLRLLINRLEEQEGYAKRLNQIYGGDYNIDRIKKIEKELDEFISTLDIATSTFGIYSKKIDDNVLIVNSDIKVQMKRLLNVAIVIFIIFLLSLLFKYLAKKTISDNERYYMANKGINFTNFILIVFVLLFFFLENVSYFLTVIGFASAGLAFAMKDLFMSILGWIVIVFGGSFHVGDRIKAKKNGLEYVGDIVDISILRMTILEDITLTTYMHNRRAGRIIFIPNNFIFTDLLANYTHGKVKTVWDGVDFTITFDSNHKKAAHLAKEIVKKYSKGYTDISRKQLNMLRSQYSLKNINVEPRIFTFMEENGIKISCWYMTNSYATLTLRSSIFSNIIDAIQEEDDIKIAYPTQIINIKRDRELPPRGENEESIF